jgi:hypothetical protein
MGRDSHETHNHLRLCDRRRWPRSLWIDGSYAADCASNALARSRSDSSAVTDRNDHRDSDPNALARGKPVAERERVAQPDTEW